MHVRTLETVCFREQLQTHFNEDADEAVARIPINTHTFLSTLRYKSIVRTHKQFLVRPLDKAYPKKNRPCSGCVQLGVAHSTNRARQLKHMHKRRNKTNYLRERGRRTCIRIRHSLLLNVLERRCIHSGKRPKETKFDEQ